VGSRTRHLLPPHISLPRGHLDQMLCHNNSARYLTAKNVERRPYGYAEPAYLHSIQVLRGGNDKLAMTRRCRKQETPGASTMVTRGMVFSSRHWRLIVRLLYQKATMVSAMICGSGPFEPKAVFLHKKRTRSTSVNRAFIGLRMVG
jgi:hypothetical protein